MKIVRNQIIFLILIKICLIQQIYSQDFKKIDSVFTLYLDFLKPADSSVIDSTNFDLVLKKLEKQQIIFDFFENISGLYLKREYWKDHEYINDGISSYCYSTNNGFTKICVVLTSGDYEKWRKWYNDNQRRLCWVVDNRTISISTYKSKDFNYIDYKSFYPSSIRFKERLNWIPVSVKPEYVKDLERKMEREGLIESKEAKVETNKK